MTLISLLRRKTAAGKSGRSIEEQNGKRRNGDPTGTRDVVADRLLRDRRYCSLLTGREIESPNDAALASAWKMLEQDMTLVPAGETVLMTTSPRAAGDGVEFVSVVDPPTKVDAVYIDRCAVTNAEFAKFVNAGGYQHVDLWPPEILPRVLQFVDETGYAGPRYWQEGQPPRDKRDHPVVGVSWYEARAYAIWTGKQLPSAAHWQHAGTWASAGEGNGSPTRYPWGSAFDAGHANTWSAGHRDTVPVKDYAKGCTPNGVYQLIGNVWEWTNDLFECPSDDETLRVVFDQFMAEIRGGAFDTYFESQVTCRFRSGKPLLYRGPNVGFRCCVGENALQPPPDDCQLLV